MDAEAVSLIVRARDEASAEFAKIHNSLDTLTSKAGGAGKAIGVFGDILKGIGMGVGFAVFTELQNVFGKITGMIPELLDKGHAFAESVDQIMKATGASAESASNYAGELEYLGISSDAAADKLGLLTKGIKAHEADLKSLGVSIRDASGGYLDQITIVNLARSAINGMTDGVNKTTLATQVFGRAGAGMLDWLNLTDRQVAILDDKLDALGVTMSKAMVENAEKAKREGNLLDLAMQGLGNTLLATVAPAITTAIDSIVNFIQSNAKAIGDFAAQVVNFVIGMINALTDGNASMVSFTATMDSLGVTVSPARQQINALQDELAGLKTKTVAAGGASAAHAAEIRKQTDAIEAQITVLKAEAAAYDLVESQAMRSLNAQIQGQLDALSVAERAHALDEQRASLAAQMAAATDPAQQAAIAQQQADLEQGVKDDARRAELAKVTDFLNQIATAEKETVDKHKLLASEKTQATALASQIAAAREKGDLQTVADLEIELQGVRTAIAHTAAAIRNGAATTELEAKKKLLAAETAAVGGAMADQTAVRRKEILKQIADLEAKDAADKATHERELVYLGTTNQMQAAVYGSSPGGLVGLFAAAEAAGKDFGKGVHDALVGGDGKGGIFGAINTVLGALGDITKWFDDNHKKIEDIFNWGRIDIPGVTTPLPPYDPGSHFQPGPKGGGSAPNSVPQSFGGSTTNIHPGAFNIVMNGVQDVPGFMQALKREVDRTGISLVPA